MQCAQVRSDRPKVATTKIVAVEACWLEHVTQLTAKLRDICFPTGGEKRIGARQFGFSVLPA
jgi:hypothetical protein